MTDVKINLSQNLLNNLLDHSGARVLIVMSGDKVVATGGPVGDSGVRVLVSALRRHWPVSIGKDLFRYVGLPFDNDYRFLSAKFFPDGNILLGLVFPLEFSLCRIREDLTTIFQGILDQGQKIPEPQDRLEQTLQFILKDYPAPDPDHLSRQVSPAVQLKNEKSTKQINGSALSEDHSDLADGQPTMIDFETGSLSYGDPLNADKPAKVDESVLENDLAMEDIPWQPLEDLMLSDDQITADQSPDSPTGEGLHETPAATSAWQTLEDQGQEEDDLVSILQDDFENVQGLTPAEDIVLPLEDLPDPTDLEPQDTEKESETFYIDEAEGGEWEAVIADITFYLVPRLKRHFLVKELPHELRRWVPEICENYGWQLDALSVRPDYLKWALRDFPESLIREMMRIVRRETSKRIFEEFPNLKHGNPTEDFWSQSYLVDRENLEISTQALIAHVAKDRLSSGKAA